MGFAILPMIAFTFYVGLQMMTLQWANSVHGAGSVGQLQTAQIVSAQQAEMWGAACYNSASAQPGVVSNTVPVTLPAGVTQPNNTGCITTNIAGGGRNIYGYISTVPGSIGQVVSDTNLNFIWYRVTQSGSAISLVSGETIAVPTIVPVGYLVDYSTTGN